MRAVPSPLSRALVVAAALAALLGAQTPPQFRSMGDMVPPSAGPVLGLADFDGDGDLDLLTNGTGIYLNDGNGRFTPHPTLSAITAGNAYNADIPSRPVAIGDLNGDGLPDVAVGSDYTNSTLVLWMSQGNGVLGASTPTYPGASIRTIAFGDLDGDGDLDIVVGMASIGWEQILHPTPLRIMLNNGAGVFVNGPSPAPAMMPRQIALADMDGDGDPDLVIAGSNQVVINYTGTINPASIYLNSGSGAFFVTPPILLPAPNTHTVIAIGDVNGDGLRDVVSDTRTTDYADCPTVSVPVVIVNFGQGAFLPMPGTLAGPVRRAMPVLMDVDGDGLDDLVRLTGGGAAIHVLGGGTLGAPFATVPLYQSVDCTGPYGCNFVFNSAAGDVDGDGDRDIIALTAQGDRILFGLPGAVPVVSGGQLTGRPMQWVNPRAGDFDGDGDVDLMLGFSSCGSTGPPDLYVALNDGTGRLAQAPPISCTGLPVYGSNGYNGSATVWFDADQDGDLDVLLAESSYSNTTGHHFLKNNGGTLVVTQSIPLATGTGAPTAIRAGDLDGDGDLDLVVGVGGSNTVTSYVLKSNAGASFTVFATLLQANTQDLALVDVDGDLDLDLVEANPSGCFLFKNDGSGVFTLWAGLPQMAASSVAVADIDGDTDKDLMLDNVVLNNDGAGNFFSPGTVPMPGLLPYGGSISLFDADFDGNPDLIDASGQFFRNLGGALAFTSPQALPGPLAIPIVHADFDGDGDHDLVMRGPRILTNVKRQLWRPVAPRPGRPAALEISGAPGTPWLLWASTGVGSLAVPPLGVVRLDLAGLQLAFGGTIPASGTSVISGTVPPGAGSIGLTVYWQAVMFEPAGARLTGLEVTSVTAY